MPIELIVLSAIIFGPLSSWLATRAGRSPIGWFTLGVLIGPIAPLLILAAPPARCPTCDEASMGFRGSCAACGTRFRGGERAASPGAPIADQAHPVHAGATGGPASGTPGPTAAAATAADAAAGAAAPSPAGSRSTARAAASRTATSATPVADMASRATGRTTRRARAHPEASASTPSRQDDASTAEPTEPTDAASTTAALPQRPPEEREILAYGVYISGTATIPIGSRYVIAVQGPDLIVQGPLDSDPLAVAVRRPRIGLDASLIDGRLLISEGSESRVRFALAFTAVGFAPGRDADHIGLARTTSTPDSVLGTGQAAPASGVRADR